MEKRVCNDCQSTFCTIHVNTKLDRLMAEHSAFKHHLSQLTKNKPALLVEIDQWEMEQHDKIRRAADQARDNIRRVLDESNEELKNKLRALTDRLNSTKSTRLHLESSVDRLSNQLEQLKEDLDQATSAIQLNTEEINWEKMIEIRKIHKIRDFKHSLEPSPRQMMSVKSETSSSIASSGKTLLYTDGNSSLCLTDKFGMKKVNIEWSTDWGQIEDCCWSPHLSRFILLSQRNLYIVDPVNYQVIHNQKWKPYKNYRSCTCCCDEQILFVGYSEDGAPLEEHSINDWTISKRWTLLNTSEFVQCIRFINSGETIAFLIGLNSKNLSRFEIRNRQTMNIIHLLQLEHFYSRLIHIPNEGSLVVHSNQKRLLLLTKTSENIQRTEIDYGDGVCNGTLMDQNCLVLRTKTELYFHDI
ncbi:unnamed protein product [Didymodactylos carnosus]|uniref:Uncharacterized protein n=1 Tax=Didymodactylos carnosus TaxID=1234261 RepID=A0A8S2E052_9BILA|nr:unnamed protein product [Didymodactylos carnosus]CAF3859018.1 unnamed protein product [Didymodactylos carnosus]